MSLSDNINDQLKLAMKAKDQVKLRSLRAIKSALMLLQTAGGKQPSEADEIAALAKMVKQRKDSMDLYREQGREDLASKEEEEIQVIQYFLPKQLNEDELKAEISAVIAQSGATGMQDMGKVMGMANQKLKGQAEGRAIADMVKKLLN